MTLRNPLINAGDVLQEDALDQTIRPKKLAHYIGQESIREQMSVFIQASRARNEPLDHTLLFGPPGLGKTTLANIIAYEMQANLKQTSGPVIEKAGDLAALLTNLEAKDVLFIDEIHRLHPTIEEVLYSAMEDYRLDILIGEGPSARSIKIDIAPFTLVGATTRTGLLTAPLRDRFGIIQRLEFYTIPELTQIVKRSANILKIEMTEMGAAEIAKRARGTPRIVNRLLRRVRDYAQVIANGSITDETAAQALDLFHVDIYGLDSMDQKLLTTLIEKFSGGPAGLESLAAAIGEEAGTIEDVIEPFLIQQNFIHRTPRGRVATEKAYLHFGLNPIQQAV